MAPENGNQISLVTANSVAAGGQRRRRSSEWRRILSGAVQRLQAMASAATAATAAAAAEKRAEANGGAIRKRRTGLSTVSMANADDLGGEEEDHVNNNSVPPGPEGNVNPPPPRDRRFSVDSAGILKRSGAIKPATAVRRVSFCQFQDVRLFDCVESAERSRRRSAEPAFCVAESPSESEEDAQDDGNDKSDDDAEDEESSEEEDEDTSMTSNMSLVATFVSPVKRQNYKMRLKKSVVTLESINICEDMAIRGTVSDTRQTLSQVTKVTFR